MHGLLKNKCNKNRRKIKYVNFNYFFNNFHYLNAYPSNSTVVWKNSVTLIFLICNEGHIVKLS